MSHSRPPRPRLFPHVADPPVATVADLEEARALYAQLDPAWFDPENDPDDWLFEPAVEAIIRKVVDEEVEAWRDKLPPDALQALREELDLACYTDPVMIEYLRRLRPVPERDRSGKVTKDALDRVVGAARAAKKQGGGA